VLSEAPIYFSEWRECLHDFEQNAKPPETIGNLFPSLVGQFSCLTSKNFINEISFAHGAPCFCVITRAV
jgi:hypothetical protein